VSLSSVGVGTLNELTGFTGEMEPTGSGVSTYNVGFSMYCLRMIAAATRSNYARGKAVWSLQEIEKENIAATDALSLSRRQRISGQTGSAH
jgi:hypothetical protein